MELAAQIRQHRTRLGLSQDELASRIYVSRQTISNWETDRTYPDVQSLLLLSDLFGTSIDSLVKGDVEVMEKVIAEDRRRMKVLGWTMVVGFVVMVAMLVLFAVAFDTIASWVPNSWGTVLVGLAMLAVGWLPALIASVKVERIKKEHDLMTYQEIAAFWKDGALPDSADTERERVLKRRRSVPFKIMTVVVCLFVGATAGWLVGFLLDLAGIGF